MAKKGKTGYLGMFAFIAIILNAVAWLMKVIFDCLKVSVAIGGRPLQDIITWIASLLLLIVALFSAHDYASKQKKIWGILFWVLAIISILAIFFGLSLPNFIK